MSRNVAKSFAKGTRAVRKLSFGFRVADLGFRVHSLAAGREGAPRMVI